MIKTFFAYQYIGVEKHGEIYQGFANMVGHNLMFPPMEIGHIEAIEQACAEDIKDKMGFRSATAILLSWQKLTG